MRSHSTYLLQLRGNSWFFEIFNEVPDGIYSGSYPINDCEPVFSSNESAAAILGLQAALSLDSRVEHYYCNPDTFSFLIKEIEIRKANFSCQEVTLARSSPRVPGM